MWFIAVAAAAPLADAQKALSADRCAEAVPLFDRALYEVPGDARAQAGLALCQARLAQYDPALNSLGQLFKSGDAVIVGGSNKGLVGLSAEERAFAERQAAEAMRQIVGVGYLREVERILVAATDYAGPSGPRFGVEAWILRAAGDVPTAWTVLTRAAATTPDDPLLVREVARFAFHEGKTLPDTLDTWVTAKGDANSLYDLVAGSINAHAWTRCLTEVRAAADRFPEGPTFGYRCALMAGDDAAIATWRSVLRPTGKLVASDVVIDVNRLVRAGDTTTAESLLVETLPRSAADTAALAGARVVLYARQGRWDEAITSARTKGVDPKVMGALAGQLARIGRTGDAQKLVQEVCDPQAEPQRTSCYASAPGFGP